MSRNYRNLLFGILAGITLSGCDNLLGPDSDDAVQYLVQRFEVVEENEDWTPFPIGYLAVKVALVNTRSDSLHLNYGACALQMEGSTSGDNTPPRVWRSQARSRWPSNIPTICAAYAKTARLGPGDTLHAPELDRRFRLADILADSLPTGLYDFEAIVRVRDEARVALGQIHLPATRFPLPEWISHRDGFRYEVAIDRNEATGAVSIGLHVSFSAPASVQSLERELSASCPIRIVAFRDSTGPTTIPPPEPAWTWPRSCQADGESVLLGPGDTRTFERTMSLEDIALGGEPGQYFLMGIIMVDGRAIRLALGQLDLSG